MPKNSSSSLTQKLNNSWMATDLHPNDAIAHGRDSGNKALIRRNGVSPGELKMLKQVSMLSHVAHPGHFIFILNAIRQAATDQ